MELPWLTEGVRKLSLPEGKSIEVRRCSLSFPLADEWIAFKIGSYTNKRPQVIVDGESLFGELAILRLAERAGWEGVWLDTYHRSAWRGMPEISEPVVLPADQRAVLGAIEAEHGQRGGPWDVLVWKAGEVAFLESKGPNDKLHANQHSWLAAALAIGLPVSAFTLVEWNTARP